MGSKLEEFLAFTYAERHRDLAWPPAVHPAVLDTDVASLLHRRKLTNRAAGHPPDRP